jgi:hypothetical protein
MRFISFLLPRSKRHGMGNTARTREGGRYLANQSLGTSMDQDVQPVRLMQFAFSGIRAWREFGNMS